MRKAIRKPMVFILLISFAFYSTGCTVIGYNLGNSVDHDNVSYEYVEHGYAHTIKPDSHIEVVMKDDRDFEATFLDADPGKSILVRRAGREDIEGPLWVMLDDVKSIMVIHKPDEARHKYTAAGAILDILVVVSFLALKAFFDGLAGLGNMA